MIAKVSCASVLGIDGYIVDVEVDISSGQPGLFIVGLPDSAIKESSERVRASLKNTGYDYPAKHITINLAPADIRKEGSAYDLPIAIGMLAAQGIVPLESLKDCIICGELSLDALVKPIRGALPIAATARDEGFRQFILPAENAREAAVVEGLEVIPVETLSSVISYLKNEKPIEPTIVDLASLFERESLYELDFNDVKGQEHVKRSMEIAAAGGHNILMIGPPGAGKTMLARRIPTILPDMTFEEAIETTKIYSVAGQLKNSGALVATRPFRSPHHTISDAALIGGGVIPKPGEVSLSHNGVLFLDELPEFKKNVLEVLRQPLEDCMVTISRVQSTLTYPAFFTLVAALNPCPCGYLTEPSKPCTCTPQQVQRYLSRISGPLLDRIDIQVEVPAVRYRELKAETGGEPSAAIRERVNKARRIQVEHFTGTKTLCNAMMTPKQMRDFCKVGEEGHKLLENVVDKMGMSARAHTRIIKVARTIADLEGAKNITVEHLSEAVQYRCLDRQLS